MTRPTLTNIILGIVIAVAGIFLLAAPEASIRIVIVLLGAGAVINGVFNIIRVRPLSDDDQFMLAALIRGIVSIIIGLLACFLPLVFFSAAQTVVRVMLYLFAIYLIFSAIAEFFLVYKLHEANIPAKQFAGEAVISIIIAIILFMIPANFGLMIIRIFGIIMIVCGAGYALYSYRNRTYIIEPDSVSDEE